MVTCEHVVRDAVKDNKGVTLYHYPAFEGETVSEGKKSAKGEIIATDKKLDLALLRSSGRLLMFSETGETRKNSMIQSLYAFGLGQAGLHGTRPWWMSWMP